MQVSKAVQFIVSLCILSGSLMAQAQLRSDLRLFSDSFLSPAFETSQKTNYQFAGATLKSPAQSEDALKMNIEGAVAFGAPLLNYLDISELYFQSQFQSDFQGPGGDKGKSKDTLIIGRKLMTWSDLDQRWDLGLWQPLFQWNPLSPEQQGLSGIFWQAQREYYGVTVFGSPLFLPNQGPSFEVSNGSFVDGNPWFRRPPDSVKIFKETTAVDYTLEKPSEAQVVFKTSYGAKLNLGSPEAVAFQLSHMYKPSNELALGYSGLLDTAKLRGQVALKPQVFYHSITGADLSHRYESVRYGVSALWDSPQKDVDLDASWTRARYEDAMLVSPFVEWIQPTYMLTLQALHVEGGGVTEVGDMASAQRAPLSLRYPFEQAVKASIENRLSFFQTRRLVSKFSYTYSDENKFEYLQWRLKCRLTSQWSGFSELELVRADDVTFENQNEIAQYRNLDRFLIGAAYVF